MQVIFDGRGEMASKTAVLLEYEPNSDAEILSKPLSHVSLVGMVQKVWK
jgi:hypothetical protein